MSVQVSMTGLAVESVTHSKKWLAPTTNAVESANLPVWQLLCVYTRSNSRDLADLERWGVFLFTSFFEYISVYIFFYFSVVHEVRLFCNNNN